MFEYAYPLVIVLVNDEGTMYRNMSKYIVMKTVVLIWIWTINCRKEPETNEINI